MNTVESLSDAIRLKASNILVADSWNNCPHLETSLEIAGRLALEGHKVTYYHYGKHIPVVEYYNKNGGIKDRLLGYPSSPQVRGEYLLRKWAKEQKVSIKFIHAGRTPHLKLQAFSDDAFKSIENLKSLEYLGSNAIGISAASSLISLTRNPNILPSKEMSLCLSIIQSYIIAYHLIEHVLKGESYNALITFNGRFASSKGAIEAAQKANLQVFYHERGSSIHKFSLTRFSPHDRISIQKEIVNKWQAIKEFSCGREVASSFFKARRNGAEQAWFSFSSGQDRSLSQIALTNAYKKSRSGKVVVFFTSSDEEYAAVGDTYSMKDYQWKTQQEALLVLVQTANELGHSVIVRVHPNLENCIPSEKDSWNHLDFLDEPSDITIIPSHINACSYELLDSANLVVSYGSTMGIESVFWNKPSLLMGDSTYDCIGSSIHKLTSACTLYDFLSHSQKWTVAPDSALPYGFYMATHGIDFRLFHATSIFGGYFIGEDIHHYEKTNIHKALDSLKQLLGVNRSS